MNPIWLIEEGVFKAEADPLCAEIRRQGMECHFIEHSRFVKSGHEVSGRRLADDDCVVFCGTYPLMRHIQLHAPCIPGGWCNAENLSCGAYYAYFGPYLLNQRYLLFPSGEAVRHRDWIYALLERDNQIFVRPAGVEKLFTGRVVYRDEFADAIMPARFDPTTLVLVATPRDIGREWRLVISGNDVVAGCQYAIAGAKAFVADLPESVRNFTIDMLKKVYWRPDDLFIMDICESEKQLYLLEINSFSCSGLYQCDFAPVIAKACELAKKSWERKQRKRPIPANV